MGPHTEDLIFGAEAPPDSVVEQCTEGLISSAGAPLDSGMGQCTEDLISGAEAPILHWSHQNDWGSFCVPLSSLLNQHNHGRLLGEMIDLCSNWERFPPKHTTKASVYVRVLKVRLFKEGDCNYTNSCFMLSETFGYAWYHWMDQHESYVTYKQQGYCLFYKERQLSSEWLTHLIQADLDPGLGWSNCWFLHNIA